VWSGQEKPAATKLLFAVVDCRGQGGKGKGVSRRKQRLGAESFAVKKDGTGGDGAWTYDGAIGS